MLETLTRGFRNARNRLQGKTTLTEDNIASALRDVRVSLLEADVELGVTRAFLARVKERAIGEVVHLKATRDGHGIAAGTRVTPAQHFIRICHEELVRLLGEEEPQLDLSGDPAIIMMVGLQGSGKTTTAGKLAHRLKEEGRRPMLVAADIYRPAAVDQLVTLGERLDVPVFSIKGMDPVTLCETAVGHARDLGRDVVIFDTAGRLAIDDALMAELERIVERTRPQEILFVADAMIGQDAVRTAAEFDRRLSFTGFVLTKFDGDARGGAALSIRAVTGKPVKFLGMGEGLDKLDDFRPEGLADRILGMGDVVGLMKDFEKVVDKETAEQDAVKMLQGRFTYDDFLKQIGMIQKLGSLRSIFEKLPGMGELMEQLPPEAFDDRELLKVRAMIQSMTKQERREPDILDPSRMERIARGSGRPYEEVEALQERFRDVRKMMGQLGQSGMFGGIPGLGGGRAARRAAARRGPVDPMSALGEAFPGLPGVGPDAPAGRPALSPEEKKALARKRREQRRARRKGRKRK